MGCASDKEGDGLMPRLKWKGLTFLSKVSVFLVKGNSLSNAYVAAEIDIL